MNAAKVTNKNIQTEDIVRYSEESESLDKEPSD